MGYYTDFEGGFKIEPPLAPKHEAYLKKFFETQHGLRCAFEIEDGQLTLQSGKNYCYHDWLAYLIEKFFVPWGYKLNGSVRWRGESFDDIGKIDVIDNTVVSEEVDW